MSDSAFRESGGPPSLPRLVGPIRFVWSSLLYILSCICAFLSKNLLRTLRVVQKLHSRLSRALYKTNIPKPNPTSSSLSPDKRLEQYLRDRSYYDAKVKEVFVDESQHTVRIVLDNGSMVFVRADYDEHRFIKSYLTPVMVDGKDAELLCFGVPLGEYLRANA